MPSKLFLLRRLLSTVQNPLAYFGERFGKNTSTETNVQIRGGFTNVLRTGTSDRNVFNDIWLERVYDLPGMQWNTYKTVIDIGAHIGLFALFAAHQSPEAKVYAYEPEQENLAILKKNITQNALGERIHAASEGVSNERGELQLHIVPGRGECHSSYRQFEQSQTIQVPVTTLEDIFQNHALERCDLLKLNCEGEEYNILLNLSDDLYKKIGAIVLNYHFFSADPNQHPRVLRAHLEERGFTVSQHPHNIFLALRCE